MRRCAGLARHGSASPWESRARHAFHEWGLPEPELSSDVCAPDGRWLARPDFLWRRRRVVGEYDGDQHRTNRSRWQYERERRAASEDAGSSDVELTSLSLVSPAHREALRGRLTRLLLGWATTPGVGKTGSSPAGQSPIPDTRVGAGPAVTR